MNKRTRAILDELYQMDASLQEREEELVPHIETLLAERPDVPLNEQFFKQLRREVLNHPFPQRMTLFDSVWAQRLSAAALGGIAAIAIAVPVTYYATQGTQPAPTSSVTGRVALGDHAFGSLVPSAVSPLGSSEAMSARPQSGGGGGGAPAIDSKMAVGVTEPGMLIYRPVRHTYTYVGDPITLTQGTGTVYRRVMNAGNVPFTALGAIPTPGIDLSAFDSLTIGSLDLREDKDNGYAVYVNAWDGSVSINQNWERWDQPDYSQPLNASELPDEREVVSLADAFLASHGINRDAYGAPVVDTQPLIALRAYANANTYVPEQLSVTYPLIVDEQSVTDEGGNPFGLQVSVGVRQRAVTSVYMNTLTRAETSNYALETDTERILGIVSKGGLNWYEPDPQDATSTVDVQLGTPTQVLMVTWQYNGKTSEQLFVPALRFPILNAPSEQEPYFRRSVTVPLVEELLNAPAPTPMPIDVMPLEQPVPAITPEASDATKPATP